VLLSQPARGQETVWTAIIPQGFPGIAFTWHLKSDGRYSEEGRDIKSGVSVQPVLSGQWSLSGGRLKLRQEGIGYVFDGEVFGSQYRGILYLDGKHFSSFCAVEGKAPPQNCGAGV
jgi:hypothetical protein